MQYQPSWKRASAEQRALIEELLRELMPGADTGGEDAWVAALEVVMAIYEVLCFGWSGSPGHFTA